MLAETKTLRLNTQTVEEKCRASHEVTQSLVVDETRLDSSANRGHNRFAIADLRISGEEVERHVRDVGELCVRLVLGVHEVFNFCHREFADTKETAARRDFVAVGEANLRDRHGHAAAVVVVEAAEVDEHALRCFGAEEARGGARGADGRRKHEVKGEAGSQVRARGGRLHAEFLEEGIELWWFEGVCLCCNFAEFVAAFGG